MSNINDLIKDYYDYIPICEICKKYDIGYTTYFKILKRANITRRISSKTNKLFNVVVEKKDDNVKQVYHKPITEQVVKVEKTDDNVKPVDDQNVKPVVDLKKKPKIPPNIKDPNINKVFNEAKQCINKVKEKYVKSGGGDDNKSELLKAIQKSNDVRNKMLNKKNNI